MTPLTAIREYARLVREGPGNEKDRLELITCKVQGAVGGLWT
ncbi:hypothetical protein JOF56_007998 [Kibdelosporangium banguiense]|uniref:Uncharacterized protein n=1 Tax=Kibdelosporangium banguiense TaxID=1365924 RepID=A0ABS4TTA4_9PSEU|nr:hypothetical protein [Kibdelosporangium banguiense]MBP2327613.1 hypothetical protein [Kibdelosporangium banguiense]